MALSLVIFFVLCVITIPFGFTIGMNSPGDPTGSLNAHLSGFSAGIFMFVGLMFYLIAAVATVHFYRFTPTSQKIVAILSITCVSLLILILVSFYNEQPETFFQKGIFFLQNNW